MIAMRYLFWNTHRNEQINPVLCDLIVEMVFLSLSWLNTLLT